MKIMTCKQLGGACDKEFHAESFKEMSELSKRHGIAMFQKKDPDHLKAMEEMKLMMMNPEAMEKWLRDRIKEFELLPHE